MDATHLHLLLNHFPVIGSLIGTLLLVYGFITRSNDVKVAACILIAVMALIALPVMKTGESAEETVENLPGVSEQLIHDHEEAAEVSLWVMLAAGALSVLSVILYVAGKQAFQYAVAATLLLSALSFGLMARTGYLGGQIRHTEIRSGAAAAGVQNQAEENGGNANTQNGEEEDDD
ncbi:hypothetical protein C7N43_06660 [Sphingobacteriales bacterium UPWRP_1]|nr:hypothetical protein BVG80_12705 [Sphingobacteriales bacterium TSM_CSM]PSJ77885.1 hypothetical protein C7N43_06660 [Sphingobacteriales bacterium UPWRP_1]